MSFIYLGSSPSRSVGYSTVGRLVSMSSSSLTLSLLQAEHVLISSLLIGFIVLCRNMEFSELKPEMLLVSISGRTC